MLTKLGFPPAEIDVAINLAQKPAGFPDGKSCLLEKWILVEGRARCYCAIANMPPANECQKGVTLIGQFRSFTAISAMPP